MNESKARIEFAEGNFRMFVLGKKGVQAKEDQQYKIYKQNTYIDLKTECFLRIEGNEFYFCVLNPIRRLSNKEQPNVEKETNLLTINDESEACLIEIDDSEYESDPNESNAENGDNLVDLKEILENRIPRKRKFSF